MGNTKLVSLVKGNNRKENIKKCLELIKKDLDNIINAKNILIKPNLTAIKPAFANTNVEAIEAVIEFLQTNFKNREIFIGESSATAFYNKLPTTKVFEDFGYYELENKYKNVKLIDFDKDEEIIKVPIESVVGDTYLRITKRVELFDYKISVTIPKTHNFAIATLGIKNMAGLVKQMDMATIHGMKGGIEVDAPKTLLDYLPRGTVSKARRTLPKWLINFLFKQYPTYRRSVKIIHKNIVSFSKVTYPDLVILDGFVCMEADGPIDGTPVELKVAVASADALKADGVGARLMGFEPEEIGYLYYLQKEGMGDYSLNGFVGDNLDRVKKVFKRHGTYDLQKDWK